jgi:hypothetical protein
VTLQWVVRSHTVPRAILASVVFLAFNAFAQSDAGAPAAPVAMAAKVTPAKVLLGESFTLELEVAHDAAQRYELLTPADLGDFDVVKVSRERDDSKAVAVTRFKVELSAFQLGELLTPAFELKVASPQGAATLPAPQAKVEIAATLGKEVESEGAGLFDIRPPVEVAVRSNRLLYALLIGLLVAAAAYALARVLLRPKPVVTVPARPKAPLHVRTVAALDALRQEDLPRQGLTRPFYFRLSEIVRSYLGERFAFEALESTTPELLETLRRLHTPGLAVKELSDFAVASDFARYAKAQPSADECKAALEFAYRLVQATTPSFTEGSTPPRSAGT